VAEKRRPRLNDELSVRKVPNEPLQPGEVTLWDAQGKLLHRCQGHEGGVRCLAFSGDGKRLASGSYDKTIRLWDIATEKTLRVLTGHEKGVERVVFSPDGRLLASGANETVVRLWDVPTGKELPPLKGHSGVLALAFSPDSRTLATAGMTPVIRLWELSTGKERAQFTGHHGVVFCLSFAADGRALASGGGDTTALVWDVSGRAARRPGVALTPAALASAWQDLLDPDAVKAGRAVWALVASPGQVVPFLREHVRPAAAIDTRRVMKLLADLDSDRFPVRQRATDELGKMGPGIVPLLRKALDRRVSREVSRRLNQLLEKLQGPGLLAEQEREFRAVEVLEHIGTAEARQVLEALAKGEPDAERTKQAKASLERLRRRPPPAP
jgi:hypothetical protein